MFVQMGHNYNGRKLAVYTSDLEKYIIENAGAYYQRKSREWMDNDSMPIYLEKVDDKRISGRRSDTQLLSQSCNHSRDALFVRYRCRRCHRCRWRRFLPPRLLACPPT